MAGLLNRPPPDQMPGPSQAGPMPGGGMPSWGLLNGPQDGTKGPQDAGGGEQPNVTPQEQQEYDQFVNNGLSLIYDEKSMPGVLERLKGDGDPVEGLAGTAVSIIKRLEDSAEQQGRKISPDVVFHGGAELFADLANLSEKAGIHKFSDKERESALYRALDMYRAVKEKTGGLDKNAISQDFEAMMQADKEGRLGDMVPGLKEKFGGAQPGPQPGPQPAAAGPDQPMGA